VPAPVHRVPIAATMLALALALAAPACSDDGAADEGASLGDSVAPTEVTPPPLPDESPPASGVVVIGGASSSFAVTSCALTPDPNATPGAETLLLVTGEGSTGTGIPFEVEVQRFATGTDVRTFTDSVTYTDTARILQMQRVQVEDQTTDLRDPGARGTLLQTRADGVAAAGLGGPPGSVAGAKDGVVGMAVVATC
jgi:hypothetical protein